MIITVEANFGKEENSTFEELAARVYEMVMGLGREMVRQVLEAQDEELMKNRDKKRYRCKGKQKTSIKTRLGDIEFRRNVYIGNSVAEGIRCVHLLDEELRIERIGQIGHAVKICVSDIRQSQDRRCESWAVCWLDPLTTPFPRALGGMRAGGVNAAKGAGKR